MPDTTTDEPPEPRRWPGSVYDGGSEPDPRFSLANERTFLAWIRTTLALLAGAAAVDTLDLSMPEGIQTAVAIVLALCGLAAAVQAWAGWSRSERALRHGRPLPSSPTNIVLVVGVGLVALFLIISAVIATT